MAYDPLIHNRKSIRLRGYDYTRPGGYFITIVTHQRMRLFGDIGNGEMRLNELGEIAADCWRAIPDHFPSTAIDDFVVMPDHMHGIVVIHENDQPRGNVGTRDHVRGIVGIRNHDQPRGVVGATHWVAPAGSNARRNGSTLIAGSIGAIVAQFKCASAKRINAIRGTPAVPVWQRNYYERIIRNDDELARIRQYIRNNPMRWGLDDENGNEPSGNRVG
jgi:putative transposase